MPTYASKVHSEGPDKLVLESGASIQVKTGGKILPNSGTQAALIADPTDPATTMAAVVSILTALKGAGIIASS
jgi:hypothetical protein